MEGRKSLSKKKEASGQNRRVGISDTVSELKCDKFVVNFFLILHTLMAYTLRSLEIKQ